MIEKIKNHLNTMTNDLKNFLEVEKEKLFDLHCINGAMYFGVVEEPCSGRETGECCHHEQTWEEAEKELTNYLKNHNTRLINFVLDLVEKEVEKMVVNTPNEVALLNKELPSTLQTNYYNQAVGYVDAVKDISTIINQLRV